MSLPVIIKDIENRFKISGGTLTGNVEINKSNYPMIMIKDLGQGRRGEFIYNINEEVIISNYKDENNRSLLFLRNENNVNNSLQLSRVVDGQWSNYNIYGEHNKPTAADVGALSLNGGTISGNELWLANGQMRIYTNGDMADIQMFNDNNRDTNNYNAIRVAKPSSSTGAYGIQFRTMINGQSSSYTLYGTHNKPTPADIGALPLTGGILDGKLIIRNEPDFLRSSVGNYGIIFRNDGSDTYILLTNSGNSLGTWNDLRPFCINNANGFVSISNGLGIAGGLQVASEATITGPLKIGSDAYGNSKNYIAFYGTSGDDAGQFNHTYIGENVWATPEGSELILYKGNDTAPTATTYSASGPDRIRHIAAAHLFQVYNSALSGSFATICTSTVPQNIFEINRDGAIVTGALKVSGAITSNNETVTTRAIQTSGNIPDITRLFTTFNNTITGYGISGDRVSGSYSFIITVKDIGTPFQLIIPDNGFHFTKRLCSNGTTYRMDFCSMSSTAPHTDMCWVY